MIFAVALLTAEDKTERVDEACLIELLHTHNKLLLSAHIISLIGMTPLVLSNTKLSRKLFILLIIVNLVLVINLAR